MTEITKEDYLLIANTVDNTIKEYVKQQFSPTERKWKLPNGDDMPAEQVLQMQAEIRQLEVRKQLAREAYLILDDSVPAIIVRMLTPLVLRRRFYAQLTTSSKKVDDTLTFVKQCLIPDGSRFLFPAREPDAYRNKHQRGFWTCKGCMTLPEVPPNSTVADLEFYRDPIWIDYRKQITWCPNFLAQIGNKTPQEYYSTMMMLVPDASYCYGGLLHAEFQVTATEAQIVRYCDTCSFTVTETKELAKPVDPKNFEVGVQLGNDLNTFVSCKCLECGEIVFEEPVNEVVVRNAEGIADYSDKHKRMLNDHYAEKHPDVA